MILPGDPFTGYRGRSAHIADTASEWLPRVMSICGRWHPRSGMFAAKPAPDKTICQRCAAVKDRDARNMAARDGYINPFRVTD